MDKKTGLLCTLTNRDQDSCIYMNPSGGTTPMSMVHLARALDSSLRVCAFAYGGMDNDFPIRREIADMASDYVEELLIAQPDGPYRLLGYCLGGTIAYEMARQLEEKGKAVDCLITIETFAPLFEDEQWVVEDYADMASALKPIYEQTAWRFSTMPPDMIKRVVNLMTIHFDAGARYRTTPINADIHVIRTESEPASLYRGWKKCSPACRDTVVIPGNTISILTQQDVAALAKAVDDAVLASSSR